MSLYAWVIVCTILGPFALSFDKKVHFYTHFRALFPAILIVAIAFLVWDEYFTIQKIWGFNDQYIFGNKLGHLPYEEVSFFIVVPFACVFVHEVLKAYFPKVNLKKFAHYFAFGFTLAGFSFGLMHMEQWYTASACIISALLTIGIYFVNRPTWYAQFIFTFLVAMIPFIIVNGILTGAVTDEPIVWYSEDHIMGPRIITIPIEDIFYNYCMLLPIVGLFELFAKRWNKQIPQ